MPNGKPRILFVMGTLPDLQQVAASTEKLYMETYKAGDRMPIAPGLEMHDVMGEKLTVADVEATLPLCYEYLATGIVQFVKFVGKGNNDFERLRELAKERKIEILP